MPLYFRQRLPVPRMQRLRQAGLPNANLVLERTPVNILLNNLIDLIKTSSYSSDDLIVES